MGGGPFDTARCATRAARARGTFVSGVIAQSALKLLLFFSHRSGDRAAAQQVR
ncbi:hypothetical protein KCP70_04860 [Salmonella enterica subsp. enterica]|nr:hypothetical protein KCP70_04860 [Salmonella enterica subsp. enterica]